MEVMNSMQVPQDVPFDERLFESNSLLKQYWETSVGGRSELANLSMQRAAQEDDLREETMRLFEKLTDSADSQAPADAIVDVLPTFLPEVLEVPQEAGPVLEPKTTNGVPWWFWLIFGIVVALLVIAASAAQVYQRPVAVAEVVATPIGQTSRRQTPGVQGGQRPGLAAGNGPTTNYYKL